MPASDPRIEQFRKMAEADPSNELGHFSLGRACLDAGDFPQAIQSFQRTLELNPNIAKAYQLLAAALCARTESPRRLSGSPAAWKSPPRAAR